MTPDPDKVIIPLGRQKTTIEEDRYLSDIADTMRALQSNDTTATSRKGRAKRWSGRTLSPPDDYDAQPLDDRKK